MKSKREHLIGIWLPLLIAGAWQWLSTTGGLNPMFFPPPDAILRKAWEMALSGELGHEIMATFQRTGIGLLFGSLAGAGLGVLMGVSRFVRLSFEPLMAALYSTPKLTMLPVVMLLFGIGAESRILLIALVSFVIIAMQTLDAIRGIDPTFIHLARNYGAAFGMTLRRVYIPATMPQVFTGLRLAATRSLVAAISVELIAGPDGLGTIIWKSWLTFSTQRLYVGVLVSAVLGIVLYEVLMKLETELVRWKR